MFLNAFKNLFTSKNTNKLSKKGIRRRLELLGLEQRINPAAFTYDSVAESLSIDLDNASEAITLTSSGGGNYAFTSTSTFTGTNTTGLSGNNTKTLTITSALTLVDIFVTDSATGTSVAFGTSTGSYVDNLDITLDNTPGNVTVAKSTTFAGSSTLSAIANNVTLTAALTMGTGAVTLTAADAINGAGKLTAGSVDLNAAAGIGNTTALSLAVASIAADSTSGKINIANALGTAVTVSSLTSKGTSDPGGDLITFDQSGGGTVRFNNVSSALSDPASGWGAITLVNTGGGITVANSGVSSASTTSTISLTTTGSGNIAVNAPINGGLNDGNVSITSAGNISGTGLITGAQASLSAQTGLDINGDLAQGFSAISSAAGDISIANVYGIAVPNAITAAGNVSLTSGQDISLLNPITATGKTVTLTATGAAGGGEIQGDSLITANTVDLNATAGIGSTTALKLAAFFVSADTTSGAIAINNTSVTAVSLTSLTTSDGAAITFDQTGGGGIGIDGPVTTGTGTITLTSQQGITGTGLITTGGTLDATAPTGLSIATAVTTFGTLTVANGPISITQTGALDLPSLTLAAGGQRALRAERHGIVHHLGGQCRHLAQRIQRIRRRDQRLRQWQRLR